MVQASATQIPPDSTAGAVSARTFLIVKAGATFDELREERGDFEDWFKAGLQSGLAGQPNASTDKSAGVPIQVLDPRTTSDWPSPDHVAGVVLTGSHSMVTDREPWSERTGQWVAELVRAKVPVLGICYGHQLLADALGGEAGNHPVGMELGTVEVETHAQAAHDPLFAELPSRFDAHVVHRQSALRLPPEAVTLASNAFEPHHAFRIGPNAWGLQFHPEFDEAAMRGYVDRIAATRNDSQEASEATHVRVGPTPHAAGLLPRFAQIVAQAERERAAPRKDLA
ncbi:glutamine amidotransferase [Variovorax dokdonensis]|uniref:Glutamine amidotransferase n=1 Tax=Variovorax dokdonensis TaxID=344883 RepID=A0ABT7NDD9_9BURK|nr:glutamine amidotransferase [Variovorax dokdonensis]MDM0045958.1 glutamine amidotransferase [Variovorax dokdonensis]